MSHREKYAWICAVVLSMPAMGGCDSGDAGRAVVTPGKDPGDLIVHFKHDDTEMAGATAKARASVATFIEALQSPKPNQRDFAVKKAFVDGTYTESIWLGLVTFDGKTFEGVIDNTPDRIKNLKLGQRVSVSPNEIFDWMYVENGRLVGGESVRALRAKLSPAEQAKFDRTIPFKM